MRCSKIYFPLAIVLGSIMTEIPAVASCMVCDEVVVLDQTRARCFAASYEQYLEAATKSPNHFAEIDLTSCTGESGNELRGLDRIGADRSPDTSAGSKPAVESSLRTMYILDAESIVCLGQLIKNYSGDYDPARFDLYESCR